jgi:hypothetical protein
VWQRGRLRRGRRSRECLGVNPANISDAGEIERGVAAFGRAPNGGLIVTPVGAILGLERSRDLITTLAARHKLPAVYWDRFFAATGGLISYGADYIVTPRPRTQHRFDCCAASSFLAACPEWVSQRHHGMSASATAFAESGHRRSDPTRLRRVLDDDGWNDREVVHTSESSAG